MIKDLTNFVRSFVYGEPPFPVCADSLYILKHILPEQIFVIVFAICVVGAFIVSSASNGRNIVIEINHMNETELSK